MKKITCILLLGLAITSLTACSTSVHFGNDDFAADTFDEDFDQDWDEDTDDDLDEDFNEDTENNFDDNWDEDTEDNFDEEIDFDDSLDDTFINEADDDSDFGFDNTSIQVEEMVGKTFSDILNKGYEYCGYGSLNDSYSFQVCSYDADTDTMDKIRQLDGLTVKDLLDEDISIGYVMVMDSCSLIANIGSFQISFEVEGAGEIIDSYKEEDSFADIEDMNELYDKTITNVSLEQITYTVILDEIASDENFSLDSPEEQLKDSTVTEFSYEPIPDALFN